MRILLVVSVKIRMRVEVNQRDPRDSFAKCAQDRESNRMIATQTHRSFFLFHDLRDCTFNARKRVRRFHAFQITSILERSLAAKIDASLRPFVPGLRVQCRTDQGRRFRRPAKKRGVVIKRDPQNYWHAPGSEFYRA